MFNCSWEPSYGIQRSIQRQTHTYPVIVFKISPWEYISCHNIFHTLITHSRCRQICKNNYNQFTGSVERRLNITMSLDLPFRIQYFLRTPSLMKPAFSSTLCEPTFSTSTKASSLFSSGHWLKMVLATIFTAFVAIPFPQYWAARTYPSSPLHISIPEFFVTEMEPIGLLLRHIALNQGWGTAVFLI